MVHVTLFVEENFELGHLGACLLVHYIQILVVLVKLIWIECFAGHI